MVNNKLTYKKWIKDENGLFVTSCPKCGDIRKTKKRPYNTSSCNKKECNSGSYKPGHTTIITEERNKKISNSKKEWWKAQDKAILNEWLGDYRGSDKHINMCKSNQSKASNKSMKNKISKPEKEYAKQLKNDGVEYKQQYFVNGYFFDFYLPKQNLLVEIDGKFYHPLKEEDCIYAMQKHNFERDIKKTKVALDMGFNLKRIRV
jgi:very-short-patch-repair endonuclease